MSTISYYNAGGYPIIPGAYFVNASLNMLPIYTSLINYSTCYGTDLSFNDLDDAYYVMPGFRITVYSTSYGDTTPGNSFVIDASSNVYPVYKPVIAGFINKGSACLLEYYDGTQMVTINQPT
jgi:hypothetical protein